MSDPLQATRSTLDQVELSQHKFQPLTVSQIQKLLPTKDKMQDAEMAGRAIERSAIDVLMQRARLAPIRWVADPEVTKRLNGAKSDRAWLASSTAGMDVRVPLPRLLKVAQEMVDVLPVTSTFPGVRAAVIKAASTKAYVGGGTHLALNRVLEHGPKRGYHPPMPPTAGEVISAMKATGRTFAEGTSLERRALAWDGRDGVAFNADADNGFPVGMTMRDPYARELVLELAGGLRTRIEATPDKNLAVRLLRDKHPELAIFKGKAKTDLYNVGKVSAGQLRFYNSGGRHLVLIMQQATQPLAEMWKEQAEHNYRTFTGKGMANGGADKLANWLERELLARPLAWAHAGDDTLLVSRKQVGGVHRYSFFSLDCTAFDLTQHSETTELVHKVFYQQLRKVDETSAALWYELMRERDVTVSGALVVRTKHWGASGMPLQSEVNDTLMEILCERLSAHAWETKSQLDDAVAEVGRGLGFKVRLEELWQIDSAVERYDMVHWALAKRPFLFVGYHLWTMPNGPVAPQIDVSRFMSGMSFLGGSYERDNAVAGVRAALVLAGYALSFGVPHEHYLPAFEVLTRAAIEAVSNKAREINAVDANAELSRYVYAGIGISVESAAGLVEAIGRYAQIWMTPKTVDIQLPEQESFEWADEPELEPWQREFLAPLDRLNLGVPINETHSVGSKFAGRMPPTPASVLHDREILKDAMRGREGEVEKAHRRPKGGARDKRSGVMYDEDDDDGLYGLD